jgi:LemA protein
MTKKGTITLGCLGLIVVIILIIGFSMYNGFVKLDEQVNQTWAQVQNQYQRRYDLIPNLVNTVKGYAAHEKETLEEVTRARASVGGVTNLNAKDLTPENLAMFEQAQAGLKGALQRLMVVVERYPDLKANQNFMDLQKQLEGTENRIATERRRFNEAVQAYNGTVRRVPQRLFAGLFGFTEKEYFGAAQEAQDAPVVDFQN